MDASVGGRQLKKWETDFYELFYFRIMRRYTMPSLTGDSSHDD